MSLSFVDVDNEDFIPYKLISNSRGSGKGAFKGQPTDVYVEVKQKSNASRAAAASEAIPSSLGMGESISVRHDVWFHIAMQIEPEDVKTFALICKQTSSLVNSQAFWRSLYRRYCLGATSGWNLDLPAQLQSEQLRYCDTTKALKSQVIKALFYCHRPLKMRLKLGYELDWLLQRLFVSYWQKKYQCQWIMCHKFCNQQPQPQSALTEEVVNDWESLADDRPPPKKANPHEGVVLLIVLCRQFVPTPALLAYSQQESRYRVRATREMLCRDMRAKNLELDFAEDGNINVSVTVKYAAIDKYEVLPWWHPAFQLFIK